MAFDQHIESIEDYLRPLRIDTPKVISLARGFNDTFRKLAAESEDQFLATPIFDAHLRPVAGQGGRYLAIDIGGTNLRVGFIELSTVTNPFTDFSNSTSAQDEGTNLLVQSRVHVRLEKSWPIGEHLKHEKAEDLFAWIGERTAEVIEDGVREFGYSPSDELTLGVTFSFPMIQPKLSEATLMSMGKGFTITSNLDLGKQLRDGYARAKYGRQLPNVKLVAIVNDTVATMIAFSYQLKSTPSIKAAMGLVVGTGTNATLPLKPSSLNITKRPTATSFTDLPPFTSGDGEDNAKVVVNTEWSIKGAAGPLKDLQMITRWDETLDAATSAPGFQPLEFMTAGRYLGELGRLVIYEYFTTRLRIPAKLLPLKLCQHNSLTTTLLGSLKLPVTIETLSRELEPPAVPDISPWKWTEETAQIVYEVAKAIEIRAAGMIAAAIIGLLACAEDIVLPDAKDSANPNSWVSPQDQALIPSAIEKLIVGYTGLCIENFQDFRTDCQVFLHEALDTIFGTQPHPQIVLEAFHNGGLVGAGVLAGTASNLL